MSPERLRASHLVPLGVRRRISATLDGRRHYGYYILRSGGDIEVAHKGRSRRMTLGMFDEYPGEIARQLFRELVRLGPATDGR
jgi:hypothetical protein